MLTSLDVKDLMLEEAPELAGRLTGKELVAAAGRCVERGVRMGILESLEDAPTGKTPVRYRVISPELPATTEERHTEVNALLLSGLTVDEVAERSGYTRHSVLRISELASAKHDCMRRVIALYPGATWSGDYFEIDPETSGNVSTNNKHAVIYLEGAKDRKVVSGGFLDDLCQAVREVQGRAAVPAVNVAGKSCGRCGRRAHQMYRKNCFSFTCGGCRALNVVSSDTPMRRLREAAGLELWELAALAEITVPRAVDIETGRRRGSKIAGQPIGATPAERSAILDALSPYATAAELVELLRFLATAGTVAVEGPAIILPLPEDDGKAADLVSEVIGGAKSRRRLDAENSDIRAEVTWKYRATQLAKRLGCDPEVMIAEDWDKLVRGEVAK
jgi:hypothetical protein